MQSRDLREISFPSSLAFNGHSDIADIIITRLQPIIERLSTERALLSHPSGVGIAITHLGQGRMILDNWDSPEDLIGCLCGWDPQRHLMALNAARMLRAAVRTQSSTLNMVAAGKMHYGDPLRMFQDLVNPVEKDGRILWGDLPYGGAGITGIGHFVFGVGVYGFISEADNDAFAVMVGNEILRLAGLI